METNRFRLLKWMSDIKNIPEKVYLIHVEPAALDAFRVKIIDTYPWNIKIPQLTDAEKILL